MSDGASEAELAAAEEALGRTLVPEHRALLAAENGGKHWYGDVFLMIYGTESLVAVNQEIEAPPGFLAFGSDGSRELIGFDMRTTARPVVMIDISSADWEEALYEAPSLTEFMSQLASGGNFRWEQPYRPRP